MVSLTALYSLCFIVQCKGMESPTLLPACNLDPTTLWRCWFTDTEWINRRNVMPVNAGNKLSGYFYLRDITSYFLTVRWGKKKQQNKPTNINWHTCLFLVDCMDLFSGTAIPLISFSKYLGNYFIHVLVSYQSEPVEIKFKTEIGRYEDSWVFRLHLSTMVSSETSAYKEHNTLTT